MDDLKLRKLFMLMIFRLTSLFFSLFILETLLWYYQRKQVSRYTDEHLTGSNYHIQLSTAERDILHACIQYNLWINIPLPKSWDKAVSVKKGLGPLDVVSTSVP